MIFFGSFVFLFRLRRKFEGGWKRVDQGKGTQRGCRGLIRKQSRRRRCRAAESRKLEVREQISPLFARKHVLKRDASDRTAN